jgi:hypothetical protein
MTGLNSIEWIILFVNDLSYHACLAEGHGILHKQLLQIFSLHENTYVALPSFLMTRKVML